MFAAALSQRSSIFKETNFLMEGAPFAFNTRVRTSFLGTCLCVCVRVCVCVNVCVGRRICVSLSVRDCE